MSARYCCAPRSYFTLSEKKECKKERECQTESMDRTLPPTPPDTQLMSNSHKCNPLCRIMFLFTFQECGLVGGVLISSLGRCFSFSLHLFLPLPTLNHLISNQTPTQSQLLNSCPPNDLLLPKEEELDYLTPPVWASHLAIFLPVDQRPATRVTEGETCFSSWPSDGHGAAL